MLVLALLAVLVVAHRVGGGPAPVDDRVAIPAPAGPSATPPAPVRNDVPRPRGPIGFSETTDTTLLFDDGQDGTLAVDLDTGAQTRFLLPGQRPGERPFRLWEMGGRLVVGRDEVFTVAPWADPPVRGLGEASTFLPAADPDQLWLVDDGGGRAGREPATWTLIDASGATIVSVEPVAHDLRPIRGVPGGLALEHRDGRLLKYDLKSSRLVDYLGDGPAWVADATVDRVVWCEDPCRTLTVSTGSGDDVAMLGSGETFHRDSVWIAGDGGQLAAAVTLDLGVSFDPRLRIYSVATGEVLADRQMLPGEAYGDWTESGDQFFSWLTFAGGRSGGPAVLSRWAGGETIEQIPVADRGITGVYGFVALPTGAAAGLFEPPGRQGSSQQGAR